MIKKTITFLIKNKKLISFFIVIFLVFLLNTFHESYPDEMDNILGGYLINKGMLPYTGFFTHHGPLAYYLASIITFISGASFVKFRILTAIFYFMFLIGTFYLLQNRLKKQKIFFFMFYIGVLALSSTYFWAHMFLADSISAYLLIPSYGILFLKMYRNEILLKTDLIIISIFSSLAVINSPTYLFAVFLLIFFSFLYYIKSSQEKITFNYLRRKIISFTLITGIPYIIFILFLFITQTFADYYYQALIYNKNYYIYNYPRPAGSTSVNPIRYAIIILDSFLNGYHVLLAAIKNVDFINPLNITLALSNFFLWIFLVIKRKFSLLLFSLLTIIYVNVRSSPLGFHPTDYQAASYVMLTFFNASFLTFIIKEEATLVKDYLSRIIITVFSFLFFLFWFFSIFFLFTELWQMTFLRYMGKMPLIYDAPQVAKIVNDIVPSNNYCWVGPFEFEEILYLKCKMPSRFHIFRRFFTEIPTFRNEILRDYTKNMPDVIVYKRNVFGEGKYPEDVFFLSGFLDKNYVRLKDIKGEKYSFISSKTKNYTLDEDFNFNKSKSEKLIQTLLHKGYLKKN